MKRFTATARRFDSRRTSCGSVRVLTAAAFSASAQLDAIRLVEINCQSTVQAPELRSFRFAAASSQAR